MEREKEELKGTLRVEQGQEEGLEGGWEGVPMALSMTQHTWALWRAKHSARWLHCEG